MAYDRLVGLDIHHDATYSMYRAAMLPILKNYGGYFRYDFKIGEVLLKEAEKPINRVFILTFPNQEQNQKFFSDPEYKKVREKYFDQSVSAATVISEYERASP